MQIECLPGDLPNTIEVDISALVDLDSAVHVSDLAIPDAVTLLTDPSEVVARVLAATVEQVADVAAETETAEPGRFGERIIGS